MSTLEVGAAWSDVIDRDVELWTIVANQNAALKALQDHVADLRALVLAQAAVISSLALVAKSGETIN
jgi:hypothetical protein